MEYEFGSYGFQFIDDVEGSPIQLAGVGLEQRFDDYYFDNRRRRFDAFLFQYTLRGVGALEQKGQKYDMDTGKAFFVQIPGEEVYYVPERPGADGWQYCYLLLKGRGAEPYFRYATERAGRLFALPGSSSAVRTVLEIYRQARTGKITTPFLATELAYRFLCRLCVDLMESGEQLSPRVREAQRIVEEEFATLEGIAALADRLGVTASHLSREFYRETGSSLITVLIRSRLKYSVDLLRSTQMPIDEVARSCGFSCGSYFSKVFKKYVGVTPYAFRRDDVVQSFTEIML